MFLVKKSFIQALVLPLMLVVATACGKQSTPRNSSEASNAPLTTSQQNSAQSQIDVVPASHANGTSPKTSVDAAVDPRTDLIEAPNLPAIVIEEHKLPTTVTELSPHQIQEQVPTQVENNSSVIQNQAVVTKTPDAQVQISPPVQAGPVIQAVTPTPTPSGATLADIRNAARSGTLTCDSGSCNPAVVMVSVVNDATLERCTGFLISDHEVMTAAHCINHSSGVKNLDSVTQNLPCQGFVYLHFASDGQSAQTQTIGCNAIEVRSGGNAFLTTDYAIIKLQARVADRAPLKISSRGFKDQEIASVARIQMSHDGTQTGFNGVQNKLDCQTSHGTYFHPELNSSSDTMVTLGNCPLIPGNSGAPVLNANGEVGGIAQGTVDPSQDAELNAELNANALDGSFGVLSVAQQLACVPELNPESSKACVTAQFSDLVYPKQFLDSTSDLFNESILPKLEEGQIWTSTSNSNSTETVYVSTPECTDSPNFTAQLLVYKKGFNQRFQADWKLDGSRSASALELNLVSKRSFTNSVAGSVMVPSCSSKRASR